ncbi:high mobility group box domain-containing protein [Dichomitus squalens]|nr:high mobility group box domain-containing protein [Dichomitus squalens]TBU40603.1 high mobility group box domain-containing protein [Dichomitus squalens]
MALATRQQAVVRTFLTTAHVSEPVASDSESPKAKKSTTKRSSATKTGTKKAATKKPKAKAKPKKVESDDPEDRLKGPLKSIKLKKEDLPPPKPATSFFLFIREQYERKENVRTGVGAASNSSEIAARWKELSDTEKQPYREKAAALKAEYEAARARWFENADPRLIRAINAQRKAKNRLKIHSPLGSDPRRPLPAFIQYMREIHDTLDVSIDRHANTQGYLAALGKAASEKWKALPEEERQRYRDEYVTKQKEYEELRAQEKSA